MERLTLPRIGVLQTERLARLERLSWTLELRLSNLFSVSQSLLSVDEGVAAQHLQHWQPPKVAGERGTVMAKVTRSSCNPGLQMELTCGIGLIASCCQVFTFS